MRVGIEVGGTFTDLVALEGGKIRVAKVPSTPGSPDIGAFNSLTEAALEIGGISDLAHGSTVATNALLERKGARIAFVTTQGFRDLLFLQRHDRTAIYDLAYAKPKPVVERRDCFEVAERIDAKGDIVLPLDSAAVAQTLIPALRKGNYAAVALCLLNAYANPAHETALAALIGEACPDLLVAPSHAVCREFREYERASTTSIAAYLQPVIDGYLGRFSATLETNGFGGRFSVMQSNGGRLPAEGMRRNAITALLSGPAAGVMGAVRQAGRSGLGNLITFDMGGTSADVCLINDGRPELTGAFDLDGLPIRTPVLDINTVGAGGGSIIWVDDGGMLRVGPRSAGAEPGPACYGRGGTEPTVTDAHLVRGSIRPEAFLGGRMALDRAAAEAAIAPVAEVFSLSPEALAERALQIATANIVRAIQIVSTERGLDPRDYALVCFGGAGGLHAAQIAEDLGIRTVLVPPHAGVMSAYGLLASDFLRFESLTRLIPIDDAAPAALREAVSPMLENLTAQFAELGLGTDGGALEADIIAEMRFVGQAFEVPVRLDSRGLEGLDARTLRQAFAEAHERIYFNTGGDRPIEIVALRVGLTAPREAPELGAMDIADLPPTPPSAWEIQDGDARVPCPAYDRAKLPRGRVFAGPALVEDETATIFLPAGWQARRDSADNLILTAA